MKSVEMWPFIGTKHACSCAKEYQRRIQWPQWWCNVNEQSLLKMQKVTSLLQKGKGIPDFVACKSTELLRPWEARCMSQLAAVHQCDQGVTRLLSGPDLPHAALCRQLLRWLCFRNPSLLDLRGLQDEVLFKSDVGNTHLSQQLIIFPSISWAAQSFAWADCWVFIHS